MANYFVSNYITTIINFCEYSSKNNARWLNLQYCLKYTFILKTNVEGLRVDDQTDLWLFGEENLFYTNDNEFLKHHEHFLD